MRRETGLTLTLAGLLALCPATSPVAARVQEQKPQVKIPEAGVPQVMTIEGLFVRAAYNNEGYAILGYKTANMSVGDEWMLLEIGATLREGVSNYTLKRDALSLDTPDGTKLPWRPSMTIARPTSPPSTIEQRWPATRSTTSRPRQPRRAASASSAS